MKKVTALFLSLLLTLAASSAFAQVMVTFQVDFYNNTKPPLDTAQVFKAWIVVLGNSVARLDSRKVVIIVPTEGMGEILI